MRSVEREESVRERIYEGVRSAVVTGRLRPGDIIREPDLAREYGTSRSPVREAFILLAYRGFLTPLPRLGYQVAGLSATDVREIHHLRMRLEVEAARLACEHITEEQLVELEQTQAALRRFSEADAPNGPEAVIEYLALNRRFHMLIAQASGSARLAGFVDELLDDRDRLQALDPRLGWGASQLGEEDVETELLAAFRRRDPEAAQAAMVRHIDAFRDRVMKRF